MRLLLAAVLLSGCAHSPRKPCEYDVHVRLTEDADAECHKRGMVEHSGVPANNTVEVYGCGNKDGIISDGSRHNIGHENGHVIEEVCPDWAEGYWD